MTHPFVDREKQGNGNSKWKIYYSHGATKFFQYYNWISWLKIFRSFETKSNEKGRMLIPDMRICD